MGWSTVLTSMAMSLAMLTAGAIHIDACPIEPLVPICLIGKSCRTGCHFSTVLVKYICMAVSGCIGLTSMLVHFVNWVIWKSCPPVVPELVIKTTTTRQGQEGIESIEINGSVDPS